MNTSPHILPHVFATQVRVALNDKGFNDEKLDRLEGFFAPYLNRADTTTRYPGIYADELDQTMEYLRAHTDAAHLDAHELNLVDAELRRHL